MKIEISQLDLNKQLFVQAINNLRMGKTLKVNGIDTHNSKEIIKIVVQPVAVVEINAEEFVKTYLNHCHYSKNYKVVNEV